MKRLIWLLVAFALMVGGIESLHILATWWQAGRPQPGIAEVLAMVMLVLIGVAWWRHSVFTCRDQCRLQSPDAKGD